VVSMLAAAGVQGPAVAPAQGRGGCLGIQHALRRPGMCYNRHSSAWRTAGRDAACGDTLLFQTGSSVGGPVGVHP